MPSIWALRITSVLLTVTGIFVASNIYTLIPIYDAVSQSFQVAENSVVIAGSLFTFFYAVGLLYFGPASDRFGRRKVIILGLLASAFSTLAVGFSDDLFSLYIARSIQGFTLGSFAPVAFAYTFDLYTPKKRTLLLVFINSGFLVAGILGQLISSSITIHFQWEFVYFFFAFCYFLLFVISISVLPKSKQPLKESHSLSQIFFQLLINRSLCKCYAITFTLLFSFVALYDAIGRYYSGSYEELFTLRAVGLIGASLSLFTGKLMDRLGIGSTMYTGFTLSLISLSSMYVFNSLLGLTVLSVLFVASISLLLPTVITLIGSLGGPHRAKALSLYSFILLTGASLAPLVVALLSFLQVLTLLLTLFMLNVLAGFLLSKEKVYSFQK